MVASARTTPAHESSESESDSDAYATSRRRAAASKKGKRLQSDGTLVPPPQRFSERRAAKVANYNEDDEFSDEEEEATPNGWYWAADDTTPGIDLVMDARLKEGSGTGTRLINRHVEQPRLIEYFLESKAKPTKYDYEFWVSGQLYQDVFCGRIADKALQIKWQDKAHYHSTWDTWDTLAQYKGYRRLENFWRGFVDFQDKFNDPDYPGEDKEQAYIVRQKEIERLGDCMFIDRVIDARDGEEETEYQVLCMRSLTSELGCLLTFHREGM